MIAAAALGLAVALAAGPGPAREERGPRALRDDEGWDLGLEDEADERKRLHVTAWGGEAIGAGGNGRSSTLLGAEVAWAFSSLEVGVAGYGYRRLGEGERAWGPVALLRVTQRFPTRGGLEAGLTFGLGAARPDGWTAWYQVALGGRLPLGPLFVSGEVGFEQQDLVRLAAGVGFAY